jgi:hemerythrin-like domain-containing protein
MTEYYKCSTCKQVVRDIEGRKYFYCKEVFPWHHVDDDGFYYNKKCSGTFYPVDKKKKYKMTEEKIVLQQQIKKLEEKIAKLEKEVLMLVMEDIIP